MDWAETLSDASMICLFIIVSIDFVLTTIATYHPKYKKNELMYEKLMLPVMASLPFWFVLLLIWSLPLYITPEVPVNIKLSVAILQSFALGVSVWGVWHQYQKYRDLLERSSGSNF